MPFDPGLFGQQVGGDVIGAGLDIAGGLLQQKQSYKYAKKLYQNRYSWAVADLRRAGLNPMLAYGGIAGMPSMAPTANLLEGAASSARSSIARFQERAIQEAQLKNLEAAGREIDARTRGQELSNTRERLTQDWLLPMESELLRWNVERTKAAAKLTDSEQVISRYLQSGAKMEADQNKLLMELFGDVGPGAKGLIKLLLMRMMSGVGRP